MIKTVELKNIKSNPFNARKDYAEQPIDELAKEIDKGGFWAGALRGRMKDGKLELAFGHRRVAALRKLGRKEVQVEIVELTDEEMAIQGLAENLQRQGLNDMEKAEGVKKLLGLLSKTRGSKDAAYKEVALMLGVKDAWIKQLVGITDYPESVKKLISERKVAARTAIDAHKMGGAEMVKAIAKEGLHFRAVSNLYKAISQIPDEKIKDKIKAKIIAGEITTPKEIEQKAEPMLRAKQEKGKPPPDLIIVIARWTDSIADWRKALKEVAPYRDYLDTNPRITKEFREEVKGLIADLEKLL